MEGQHPNNEEISFDVVCEKLPVTALLFEKNLLYTAQGGTLQVFEISANEKEIVGSIPLFKQSVIYGISVYILYEERHLLCFGGKSLCIIKSSYAGDSLKSEIVSAVNFKDWVLDGMPVTYKNNESCFLAIALAHNSILLYNHQNGDIIKEVHCAEKCILYSAHFVKNDRQILPWEQLKVCCGTVFNQIIIWKPHNKEGSDHVKDVIRLSSHDGVIFNLSYNPATKLLLSASDDRSIRVWKCPYLSDNNQSQVFDEPTSSSSHCLCAMYGHEARVWKVESFLKNGQAYITSVAEDGYCILWKLSLGGSQVSFLIARKMDFHSNLLSLAFNNSNQLAIGGLDGSVRVLDFANLLQPVVPMEAAALGEGMSFSVLPKTQPRALGWCRTGALPSVVQDSYQLVTQPKISVYKTTKSALWIESTTGEAVGVIKTIKLLTKNNLSILAHSDVGALLLYTVASCEWTVLERDNAFGSYAVMSVNENEDLIAFGNTKGSLKVMRLNGDHDVISSIQLSLFHGKVLSITWSQNNLFVSGPSGVFNWYLVHGDGVVLKVVECSAFTLPPAKHRWHTAVAVLTFNPHVIVCGDRRGSVHTFVKGTLDPVSTTHGVHGKLGVTSLKQDGDLIMSTGRDGRWRTWNAGREIQLESTHRASQGMAWVEGCDVVNCNTGKKLYVHGFHGNKFIVWSKFSGDELFSVSCGGGHRSWDFSIHLSKFVFLKAGKLNIVETMSSITNESIVSAPLHSQHINYVRHLATYSHGANTIHIVATAGEDTNAMVSAIIQSKNLKSSKFQTLYCIDDHLSNVRCIAAVVITDGPVVMEMMMYTAGGRASLNAYRIKLTKNILPSKIRVNHVPTYTRGAQELSEMRFMSITAWSACDDDHRMAVACSDGKIRIFQIKKTEIDILCETREYKHCFLTVSRLNDFVISGSTSGTVYLMTSSLVEVMTYKGHQSGVNSIAWVKVANAEDRFLVASGGDDNAIHLAILEHTGDSFHQKAFLDLKDAHAAQITGLHIEEMDSYFLLSSVSIDQRMTTWRVHISENLLITCRQSCCCFIHVADVAGMDAYKGSYFVGGQGLVMLKRDKVPV